MMQCLIFGFLLKTMGFTKAKEEFYSEIKISTPKVNIVRFLCAYLLHLLTIGEVQ